ncbi:MAG: hypothetical protein IMX00_03515 [Limnochordales bacterium]|nr:hypothetical protein [Limnochordales bacterium]
MLRFMPFRLSIILCLAVVALGISTLSASAASASPPWHLTLEQGIVTPGSSAALPWQGTTYRLGITAQQLGSSEQLTLAWGHLSALETGESLETLALDYTYRQMLLVFGYVRFASHLALQVAPDRTDSVGAELQLRGEAVVGNLGGFFRVAYRSPTFAEPLFLPAPDLFPAWPLGSQYAGAVAETEFRSRLNSRTTWVGNIAWRWPPAESPQVGLAFGPELSLGDWGRIAGKIGFRSQSRATHGILGLSTRLYPAPSFLVRLDATADSTGRIDWSGGVGFDLEIPGFRGTASLVATQREGDPTATFGTSLTASLPLRHTEISLDYQLSGAACLTFRYQF